MSEPEHWMSDDDHLRNLQGLAHSRRLPRYGNVQIRGGEDQEPIHFGANAKASITKVWDRLSVEDQETLTVYFAETEATWQAWQAKKKAANGHDEPTARGTTVVHGQSNEPSLTARRLQLLKLGYHPLPNDCKIPVIGKWNTARHLERELRDIDKHKAVDRITRWITIWPKAMSTGVRLDDGLGALDGDIVDAALSAQTKVKIAEIAPEVAAKAPLRHSAGSKFAYFVDAEAAFVREASAKYVTIEVRDAYRCAVAAAKAEAAATGEPPKAVKAPPSNGIEIWGGGQRHPGVCSRQFGIDGVHAVDDESGEVRSWYSFADDRPSLFDIGLDALPKLTRDQACAIVNAFVQLACNAGLVALDEFEDHGEGEDRYDIDVETTRFDVYQDADQVSYADVESMVFTTSDLRVSPNFMAGEASETLNRCSVYWSTRYGGGCVVIKDWKTYYRHYPKQYAPATIDKKVLGAAIRQLMASPQTSTVKTAASQGTIAIAGDDDNAAFFAKVNAMCAPKLDVIAQQLGVECGEDDTAIGITVANNGAADEMAAALLLCTCANVNPRTLGYTGGVRPQTLDQVHAVFTKWFSDSYDLDAIDGTLAAAAVEQLDGDPIWLLLITGPGGTKTESVQSLIGAGAHVTSTIASEGALLSGIVPRGKAAQALATGGLLRKIGDRGILVIKDVTSVLSANRDIRGTVLAALREIYDGRWERNLGSDGGKTLTWTGRIVVIGAVTTKWDTAHEVIAACGDRFVLLRTDSSKGRLQAGAQAIRNTGSETEMRQELADVVGGLLGTIDPRGEYAVDEREAELLLKAADIVTYARTAVERDYQGNVIDAHAPEMPTRFAKQLAQMVRRGLAIGLDRAAAMKLALRCARDSIPPLRFKILLDVAKHPRTRPGETRKRVGKPWRTVLREMEGLHMLGLLHCDEVPGSGKFEGKISKKTGEAKAIWKYRLADGFDSKSLLAMDEGMTRLREFLKIKQGGSAGAGA